MYLGRPGRAPDAGTGTVLKAVKENLRAHRTADSAPARCASGPSAGHLLPGLPPVCFNYLGRQKMDPAPGGLLHAPHGGLTGGMDRTAGRLFLLDVLGCPRRRRAGVHLVTRCGGTGGRPSPRLAAELTGGTPRHRPALRRTRRRRPYPSDFPPRAAGPGGRGPARRRRSGRHGRVPAHAHPDRHGDARPGRGRTRPVRRADHLRGGRRPGPRDGPRPGSTWSTAPPCCAPPSPCAAYPCRSRSSTAAALPVTEHDWSGLPADRHAAELERLLADERARGTFSDRAPAAAARPGPARPGRDPGGVDLPSRPAGRLERLPRAVRRHGCARRPRLRRAAPAARAPAVRGLRRLAGRP